jgi:hypothetical protein
MDGQNKNRKQIRIEQPAGRLKIPGDGGEIVNSMW